MILAAGVEAQDSISGTVRGPEGESLSGAIASLARAGVRTESDDLGRFELSGVGLSVSDTLVVRLSGYATSAVPLGDLRFLTMRINVVLSADPPLEAGIADGSGRELAEESAAELGGRIWRYEDFRDRLSSVEHFLELLAFSGMVDAVRLRPRPCVVIRTGVGCADLRINNFDPVAGEVPQLDIGTINSFVVVAPSVEAFERVGPDPFRGAVLVFTHGGGR